MTTFSLRLPGELKAMASTQAARADVSHNRSLATLVAAHVCAQAKAERAFAARAPRERGEAGNGAEHPGAGWQAAEASGRGSAGRGMTLPPARAGDLLRYRQGRRQMENLDSSGGSTKVGRGRKLSPA